jgi:hypothetical protein
VVSDAHAAAPSPAGRSLVPAHGPLDVDGLLRGEGLHAVGHGPVPIGRLALILVLAGGLYGAVMGCWDLRWEQCLYSAVKVPALVVVSWLVCLPNFYVVNSVLGLREDFSAAFRGVLSAQATLAVGLASLAPIVGFFYLSTDNYHVAKLINAAAWLVALIAAQVTLARHYRPLLVRDARHTVALLVWPTLYFFVAAQLAYVLRPFLGNPEFPSEFLRSQWWGNVYVDLWWALRGAIHGS